MSHKKSKGEEIKVGSTVVKLYTFKRGDRTIYSLNSYLNGRRQVRQFSNKTEAKAEAQTLARRLDAGHRKVLSLTDDDAFIYAHALEAIKPTGRTIGTVAAEFAEAHQILGGIASITDAARFYVKRHGTIIAKTIPEVLAEVLAARANKSERHVKDLRHRLSRFSKYFTGFIANVTQRELALWLEGLELGSRSHDNYRRAIILLFRFAQKRGYLPDGKTEAEKTELIGNSGDGEIEIFTPDEMRRLLKSARQDTLAYLTLGAFAGVRTAEISRLNWSEINFANGYIEIKKAKAKTKGRRLIKMQPNLVTWLKTIKERAGPVSSLVRPEKTAADIVCRATKTEGFPSVIWKHNGLRHSYCSYRMAILQNEHQVSAEMGNSPAMIYANYRELVTKEQAEEWFDIVPEVE